MKQKATFLLSFLMISFLMVNFALAGRQTEAEPNDTFKNATLIDNVDEISIMEAQFSSNDDVDIFKIYMTTDKIYHIYSDSSKLGVDVGITMYFESDTTVDALAGGNILNGDPAGRAGWSNFRIAGWAPFEYGEGWYYIRLTPAEAMTGTGEYLVRLITQDLNYWADLHEPDNSFQDAFNQFALPIDGNRFNGMLFDKNNPPTGADDVDYFYMAGVAGKRLWIETEPVQGYPHTRDMDSKIYVYDADGTQLLGDNDDKSNQEEDFGANNVFSLVVLDSLPYTGLYYVIITSYYSSYNGHSHTDSDPSTGGYVCYSWMGETQVEIEPNDTPEEATPLCEGISGSVASANNNLVIDATFDGTADVFAYNLKTTKMYSFNTLSSDAVDADVQVEILDSTGTNLIDNTGVGKYGGHDFRISGWTPPENGVYYVKLSGPTTGAYKMRMGWATLRKTAVIREANDEDTGNDTQNPAETHMVGYDSDTYTNAIYPAGDVDWFWFNGTAGDVIDVETFSALDTMGGLWGRDFDTKMTLIDPSGTTKENDDYRPDDGSRHPGNVFSAIRGYTLEGTGVVWIKVEGYYKNSDSDGKNAVGAYRLFVYSSAAAPAYEEKEPNDTFAQAMGIIENKDIVSEFSKNGSPSADDIDIYKMELSKDRMYFINSYGDGEEDGLGSDIHAELYAESDTTTDLINPVGGSDGRYNGNNFRISGFIPPADGIYYVKLSIETPGDGKYNIRYRSTSVADYNNIHEPDNSIADADAQGEYPIDGVTKQSMLYNGSDANFYGDEDYYRFTCIAGQMFVAETAPVAGKDWGRDTDTKLWLYASDGTTEITSNDDGGAGIYSKISVEIPSDGVYYLKVATCWSSWDFNHPGAGDYLLTVSATTSEVEPNDTPEQATEIPIANNNLVTASFSAEDLVDWFKVSLEAGKWYYFNTADSKVAEDIEVEVYAEGNTTANLIDNTPFGRFNSGDFRLSAWTPPASGNYLLKLTVPVSAIDVLNTGVYKLRAAGGEDIVEMAAVHEPDNNITEAAAAAELTTDSTAVLVALGDSLDHDIFAITGEAGKTLEIWTSPGHGDRWIREIDTKIRLLDQDSVAISSNDDYDDWYELNFYKGEVSNTYSKVVIDSLPYTGTYYIDCFGYYSTYNGKSPSIGSVAHGSYNVTALMKSRTVDDITERSVVPEEYALMQNYPNPFNPTTTIKYQLKQNVDVKMTIYNVLGQKVITLVDSKQSAGTHQVVWNGLNQYGSKVATGIYFYHIQIGDKFSQVKKMILMK